MDYLPLERAARIATMLTMGAWMDAQEHGHETAFVAAKKDEWGRWHIPGLYDTSALPGEENNQMLWHLLAAIHNAIDGIEGHEAVLIARAILGQRRSTSDSTNDAVLDRFAEDHVKLESTVQAQAKVILWLADLVIRRPELTRVDHLKIRSVRTTSLRIIGEDDDG